MQTALKLILLLMTGVISQSAFALGTVLAQSGHAPVPSIGEKFENYVSPEALKPALDQVQALCLKRRNAFAAKYTAVEENPKATCDCVIKALAAKKVLSIANEGVKYYSTSADVIPDPEASSTPTSEYVLQAEENCRVEPKWVTSTNRPSNYHSRFMEIEHLMEIRHRP